MGVSNVIDTLELNIVVNNKGTTARINNTTNALKNLRNVITDINGAGGVDGAVNGGGGSVSSSRGGSSRSRGGKSASSLMKNLNFGSMIAKLYFVRNITKQLGQNLAKVVQYGIDYEETLNLWQVAMRGNISQARIFVSEMNKAYGISSATVMNYQATFKNMLSALNGLNEEVAYGLSEALTGMALDYASLYNTSVESAMTKFQAVLAGQVRPIRSESGYDITESTIFNLYQSLGGTKSIRQLDQMEKRLLRILAVYKQMQGTAVGDLAKTITSSANQLRVMKEQSKEFATWIGVAFNTLLEKSGILVEINAYLYALSALAKQFAISLGYVEKDYSIKEPIEEANTALDGANQKVDELKGKLLGFDKFQVLSSGTDNTDAVDLSEEILKAIQEYQSIVNNAENPAFEKSLEILERWGLLLDKDGNIVGGFDEIFESVKDIAKTLGVLVGALTLVSKPILVIVAALEYAYWTNEEFRKSINKLLEDIWQSSREVAPLLQELFVSILPVVQELVYLILEIVKNAMPAIKDILEKIVDIMPTLVNIIKNIFYMVGELADSAVPVIAAIVVQILDVLQPILEILEAISYYLVDVFPAALFVINTAVTAISLVFETILNIVKSILEIVKSIFSRDFSSLGGRLKGIWENDWNISIGASGKMFESGKKMFASFKADGGMAEQGTLFYAGEAGPELVTKTSGGNSTIMNMQQLNEAVKLGFIGGLKSAEFADFKDDLSNMIATTTPTALVSKGLNKVFGFLGFANGGLADKGSLFYAGEAGPELVTHTSGGGSTIMNMRQLEDAVARGFIRGSAATQGDEGQQITVNVSGRTLFSIFVEEARSNGYELVKVR